MTSYWKLIIAAIGAVLAAILPGLPGVPGESLDLVGVVNVVVLAAGALQVFNAPNVTGWNYAKTVAAVLAAIGVVVISALSDSFISSGEWTQIVIAGLTAAGVYAIPNTPSVDTTRQV